VRAVDARRLLQHDLVKAQPDVVHAERGDVADIILCEVRVEMLEIAG
jgi:hypothetical protein